MFSNYFDILILKIIFYFNIFLNKKYFKPPSPLKSHSNSCSSLKINQNIFHVIKIKRWEYLRQSMEELEINASTYYHYHTTQLLRTLKAYHSICLHNFEHYKNVFPLTNRSTPSSSSSVFVCNGDLVVDF
jgi:hypothetical protein